MTWVSGPSWWEQRRAGPARPPVTAPELPPDSRPPRIPQPRDARGRFVRPPGPRSAIHRATGCEVWLAAMRGKTPWEDGRAVLTTRWEARYGPIPPGHRLVRICDRSRCVNLDHAVLLDPGQAQVYRYAGTERFWLGQEEAD